MATTDKGEWILLDTDLTTQLAILPAMQSHLYLEINEPGSGQLQVPLDSTAASQINFGMFCACYYRGSYRGGFFVDDLKKAEADSSEGGGRILNVSGRGALALLTDGMVWHDGTSSSQRTFTSVTKASILIDLIDEAQSRGCLANLTYDFTASDDSASVSWTDSESYSFNVGTSLLDVIRRFVKTADMEVAINFVAGEFVLSAYKNGLGTNKASTLFFRVGSNCEEVSQDERGDEISNVMLLKYGDGYAQVSDPTSIAARRRREKLLNIESAQSSDSAVTYGSAILDSSKDPHKSIAVKVFDGVKPYLFIDYVMGDTITVDRFGSNISYRVLGIQADFNGDVFSDVTVELNWIIYENDLKMQNDLDWLLDQWNTAKDADLTEVKEWMSIGNPNGPVRRFLYLDGYLYVGGDFTEISGKLVIDNIAAYNVSTGRWEDMAGGLADDYVKDMVEYDGDLHVLTESGLVSKVYEWSGTAWTLLGTSMSGSWNCLAADASYLYAGGAFNGINPGVAPDALGHLVAAYDGANWSIIMIGSYTDADVITCRDLEIFLGNLHGGFLHRTGAYGSDCLLALVSGTWTALMADPADGDLAINRLEVVNDELVYSTPQKLFSWDGSALTPTELAAHAPTGIVYGIKGNLSDIYFAGSFTSIDSNTGYNGITRYSGGVWSKFDSGLQGGATPGGHAVEYIDGNVFVGGEFQTAGGKSSPNLAVWVTTFQNLVDLLAKTGDSFDMGAAIHAAPASAVTDNDEFPFWEDVAKALRKITWVNIKSTLINALNAIFVRLDGTNAPMTGQLQVIPTNPGDGGAYIETSADAYPLDTEQYTVNDDVSSPVWFGYRETSGTGNIPSAFVELWQEEDGAGTITGPWIYLYDSGTSTVMFEVDVAGNVKPHGTFQPPSLADSAAPNNSIYYSTDASKLVYKDSGGSVHNLY